MGWLRLVGCLKIYVSLQNIGLFCRALLQKRPIFLRSQIIVATPYVGMRHAATHCNTLQHVSTHCNTLQHTATLCNTLQHSATHCNTLQHTATHCNTLQHTATLCNTRCLHAVQLSSMMTPRKNPCDIICNKSPYNTLQHAATRCSTLQHAEIHCNTLQHTVVV